MPKSMTGGEAVYETLRALGIDTVFGIPSVHNIPIYDAILRLGGIRPISVRHEQGALHAADGYARVTGKLGVAITSTGPGATNAMTGLFEAGFASSKVLMITGQVESLHYGKGKGVLHEAENQLTMLEQVTGSTASVRRPEEVGETLFRVARDVSTGRPQPGAVEIPIDLQFATTEIDIPHQEGWDRAAPVDDALAQAVDAVSGAKQLAIWAGGGVISANASAELTQLAERLNAPVFTSTNGRGAIPEDHALAMGPTTGLPACAAVLSDADVVLAVGTRFQGGSTQNWALPINGTLVHLDADPAVINRNYPADVAVVADARLGLAGLLRKVSSDGNDASYTERAQAARDEARAEMRAQIGPDYESIMDAMRAALPSDANIVRDATVPAYTWGNRLFPILEPRTSIGSTSAAIGPGLPLAIGAAIGSGKKTALIQGDGGFMLNLSELATAAQYELPLIICLFNDQGYGVLRMIQERTFEGRQVGVDLHTPDFVQVSQGMGVSAERVSGVAEFEAAFSRAVAADGPVLLDIDMSVLEPMSFGPPPRRA